jgi:aspartate/methionine/tyrosine aminotransferase
VRPTLGDRTVELFERARNPADPFELRDLYIGRVESMLPPAYRSPLACRWTDSRRRRRVDPAEVLSLPTTSRFVKELFNHFFRDDLYGRFRSDENLILSSGSAAEATYGLPQALRQCVGYAMDRDWYGYSDSRGRLDTREAIARLESARVPGARYGTDSIAVTMGGTFAMNAVADFLLHDRPRSPSLCLAPNYPPLVEAISRRAPIQIVPAEGGGGQTDLGPLIAALRPGTPVVMLQTVTNPTGCRVDEDDLARLIAAASQTTMVVLDEAHECAGPAVVRSPLRAAPNVIRLVSLSKSFSVPGLKLGWIVSSPEVGRGFYEYASTSYGGPPSVFALFLEVLARFERWLVEDVCEPTAVQLRELDGHYGVRLDDLRRAFAGYRDERERTERGIVASRQWTEATLAAAGADVVAADHSINVTMRVPGAVDSYEWFRRTLHRTGVAVYPGYLNFLFDDACVRLTSAAAPDVLREGVARLSSIVTIAVAAGAAGDADG